MIDSMNNRINTCVLTPYVVFLNRAERSEESYQQHRFMKNSSLALPMTTFYNFLCCREIRYFIFSVFVIANTARKLAGWGEAISFLAGNQLRLLRSSTHCQRTRLAMTTMSSKLSSYDVRPSSGGLPSQNDRNGVVSR